MHCSVSLTFLFISAVFFMQTFELQWTDAIDVNFYFFLLWFTTGLHVIKCTPKIELRVLMHPIVVITQFINYKCSVEKVHYIIYSVTWEELSNQRRFLSHGACLFELNVSWMWTQLSSLPVLAIPGNWSNIVFSTYVSGFGLGGVRRNICYSQFKC